VQPLLAAAALLLLLLLLLLLESCEGTGGKDRALRRVCLAVRVML